MVAGKVEAPRKRAGKKHRLFSPAGPATLFRTHERNLHLSHACQRLRARGAIGSSRPDVRPRWFIGGVRAAFLALNGGHNTHAHTKHTRSGRRRDRKLGQGRRQRTRTGLIDERRACCFRWPQIRPKRRCTSGARR